MPRLFRIRMRVDSAIGPAISPIPVEYSRRQGPQQGAASGQANADATLSGQSPSTAIIVAASVVGLVLVVCFYLLLRMLRARHPNPECLPLALRKMWQKWKVPAYHAKAKYRPTDADDDRFDHRVRMREAQDDLGVALHDALDNQDAADGRADRPPVDHRSGVTRTTSVHSVMTLPAYRPNAAETERVLGREGERAGVDTVVEMPTAEQEEALREEEMDALYQIRLARRRQLAEREQRRQERREARERHDHRALQDIRQQSQLAVQQATTEVEDLREIHDAIRQTRQRAVSQVSYHDVGLVRADGTRLGTTNNNTESERVGLLSDAASIARSHLDASSLEHRRPMSLHSLLSINTSRGHQDDAPPSDSPGMASRHSGTTFRSQRAGPSPELIDAVEADLGHNHMPPDSPPGYDDVSLDGPTPAHSPNSRPSAGLTGRDSPYNEPPPGYPGHDRPERPTQSEGPTQARQNRLSAQMADLAELQRTSAGHSRTGSTGVDNGPPQLPSLTLNTLPQIVVQPSSTVTRDEPVEEHRS